jgi:membrane-bound serine protease (ClpP class)
VMTLAIVGLLTWKTLQLRISPATTGLEGMVGQVGRVVGGFGESPGLGKVVVHGEYWDADGPPGLSSGEQVKVVAVDGLRLRVERRS